MELLLTCGDLIFTYSTEVAAMIFLVFIMLISSGWWYKLDFYRRFCTTG